MDITIHVDTDAEAANKIEKLETALTLARTSREWNRKRVVELEDQLERAGAVDTEPSTDRLFTSDEVGRYQATEAELVATPLRRRIGELETALARSIDRENRMESDQADRDAEHRRSIAARDSLLAAATTRVKAALEILTRPAVVGARNEIVTTKGAILADAIGNATDALGGPPASPAR